VSADRVEPPRLARAIRMFSIPVIVAWLAVVAGVNLVVPPLEAVAEKNAVSLSPNDAPSMIAMKRMGKLFHEFDSDSMAMVVLEGDHPLGPQAHQYYDRLIQLLQHDKKHIEHVANFWGDLITAAGSQSTDGKAAYVQLNLAGNMGEPLQDESVRAVRAIVAQSQPPPGLKVYVTGHAPILTDMTATGAKSMVKMTTVAVIVITTMLFIFYRSITTVMLLLSLVFVELGTARGIVAILAHFNIVGLSSFATSLLTPLVIAAGTDYGIFLLGRYQEARQAGENRESAYYTAYGGVAHVIVGSGLTVAGGMLCLKFTRLSYFSSISIPCVAGIFVVIIAALTLAPAIIAVASRFGLLDPKRQIRVRTWRRIGTAVVRWPKPILVGTFAAALIGLLALPGYKTSYNDRHYVPTSVGANVGYAAAERHFTAARMNPDVLAVEADHDMRDPGNMLVLDRIAKSIFHLSGIAGVQSVTRPLGSPIAHSSIPFQVSVQSVPITQNLQFLKDRVADMQKASDDLGRMTDTMERTYGLMRRLSDTSHAMVSDAGEIRDEITMLRDQIADFDEFWRPIRNYFHWEAHCYDIPVCWSSKSIFGAMDDVDKLSDDTGVLLGDMKNMDSLLPQLMQQLPPMIAISKSMQTTTLATYSTLSSLIKQMERMTDTASAMGEAFDAAKNDDFFYLPPEAFDNPDFQRGLGLFMSPDGKAARFIITHDVDPATVEGVANVDAELKAAHEAVKGTPLAGAKFYLGGTAATFKDIQVGSKYDLMIVAVASVIAIFIVMLIITRALIAAFVIVSTVALSLAASFGLSVLLWQYILGIELHWITLVFSVIVLLAVGSDYNLLLVARFKEELGAGFNTAIIRSMAGTGTVVTAAGLVFAFTMASMVSSDLRAIGQVGTTIGLGLLFDTLIVRSLMTPSIAALLGRWFWWPMALPSRAHVTAPEPLPRILSVPDRAVSV
jgi:putative drug exporter of the RND superfamily